MRSSPGVIVVGLALAGCERGETAHEEEVVAAAVDGAAAAGRVTDATRVLAAEVALLRGQPGLAEMLLREVESAAPWAELPGWTTLAATLRGQAGRQIRRVELGARTLAFAVSADGRHAVATGPKGQVRVWLVEADGVVEKELIGADQGVERVAIAADGSRVAGSGEWGHLWLWDAAGPLIAELERPSTVDALAFRPDGKVLAATMEDGSLRAWVAADGQVFDRFVVRDEPEVTGLPALFESEQIFGMAWRPDGQRIATGDDSGVVREWTFGQAAPVVTVAVHAGRITALTYSADGQRLISGSMGDGVKVLDLRTREAVRAVRGLDTVVGVAVSPDARFVAAASLSGQTRAYDVTRDATYALAGAEHPAELAYSGDGGFLLTADADGDARLWRGVPRGVPPPSWRDEVVQAHARLRGHAGRLIGGRFTADDGAVTVGTDGTLRWWWIHRGWAVAGRKAGPDAGGRAVLDATRGVVDDAEATARWRGGLRDIVATAYSADRATVAVATMDAVIVVLRVATGETVARWSIDMPVPEQLVMRADGTVAARTTGQIRVWSAAGQLLAKLDSEALAGQHVGFFAMAWSPDGSRLALARRDDAIELWEPAGTSRSIAVGAADEVHARPVAVAWSPDGGRVAAVTADGELMEWRIADGELLARWSVAPPLDGESLAYASDGRNLLVVGEDREVRGWPAVPDAEQLMLELWGFNRVCPSIAERVRWLHLEAEAAAEDHARCVRMLRAR